MNLNHLELIQNFIPLLVSLITLFVMFGSYRLRNRMQSQERQIRHLNQELNALLSCSRGISEKLHHYQHQFRHIIERQDKLEVGEQDTSGYKQAIALFNRGATEEELLSTCDLSRGELNLIAHLQKARAQKSSHLQ